ncbi:substrate-binding periplasmic protein [Thalassospira xiamenensis]|uniref:Amino acid ABC transporter substrate-binding protein, PAAT family n=1 Tax=Thalassospira xiamenensis TaxID=220697 RepID=A0A285RRP0_9PROT|nr:transporter substrate-binding domain-containing protein [Thalassospira xiamenensis]SOB94987.1 amino acid ABC transporter substrate-binding protein, PAAT family [Thalassospira xiamenensis]
MTCFRKVWLAASFLLLVQIQTQTHAKAHELPQAGAHQTLVIVTNDYPPYIHAAARESFLPDLFRAIGQEMNVSFEFHFKPWKRGEQDVENLEAWGTLPYRRSEERERKFNFSDALYIEDSPFFAYNAQGRKPAIPYEELSDLKPYRLGGIQGYYYQPWFDDAGLNVEYALTEEQNFKMLHIGRIDLFSTARSVGWYVIRNLFPPEEAEKFYTIEKPLLPGSGLFLMTSKDYPNGDELLERFNTALAIVKQNGTFESLMNRHELSVNY